MRSAQQILDLILTLAAHDERIRAVAMNGSRVNPNCPVDLFQDFDIVYLVNDMASFIQNPNWVDVFGERIIMQTPDQMSSPHLTQIDRYAYLMLFADGNRIDLTLVPIDNRAQYCRADSLTVILLDKDQALPDIPLPSDKDYWVKRPTPEAYAACCNEFWWVSTYVAKGLWRNELLYAQDHMNMYVRPMLIQMLEWHVGFQTDFKVSVGKNAKYLEQYMPASSWKALLATFAEGSYSKMWASLFAMGELFRSTALAVGNRLNVIYNHEEDERVTQYLRHVHQLPPDAEQFSSTYHS